MTPRPPCLACHPELARLGEPPRSSGLACRGGPVGSAGVAGSGGPACRGRRSEGSVAGPTHPELSLCDSECAPSKPRGVHSLALSAPAAHEGPLRAVRRAERGGIIFKFMALCCFVVFLFAFYLVRHPLMRVAGRALIVDDSPRASDAIVMLGDDDYNADRATRAAELIKGGWAPRVVASGRFLRPYLSISDLQDHDLIDRGVPPSAILKFPNHSRNTLEECTAVGGLLTKRGWKHILIVTSNYHTRRAEFICSRVLPEGTELHVIAANDSNFDPHDWWDKRESTKIFFQETEGLAVAAWELRSKSVETQD